MAVTVVEFGLQGFAFPVVGGTAPSAGSSQSVIVASRIVVEINGHTWTKTPQAFTAARGYYTQFTPDEVKDLRVTVLAITDEEDDIARDLNEQDIGVYVDVQRLLSNHASVDEMDQLVDLVGEMKDFFSDQHRLAGLTDYYVAEAEYLGGVVWSFTKLHEQHTFEAALKLTIRTHR